jgi:serine protease Do
VQISTDPDIARQLNVESGVVLRSVVKDGPAAKAGIRSPWRDADGVHVDVIVAIDDEPVRNAKDLYSIMEKHKIGDVVKVTVERDGQRRDVSLTLGSIG